MPFLNSLVNLLIGFKFGSYVLRKISYKLFLRKSIYKQGLRKLLFKEQKRSDVIMETNLQFLQAKLSFSLNQNKSVNNPNIFDDQIISYSESLLLLYTHDCKILGVTKLVGKLNKEVCRLVAK